MLVHAAAVLCSLGAAVAFPKDQLRLWLSMDDIYPVIGQGLWLRRAMITEPPQFSPSGMLSERSIGSSSDT